MEITRSIGYVQLFFGIFLIVTGITAAIMASVLGSQMNRNYSSEYYDVDYESLNDTQKILHNQQKFNSYDSQFEITLFDLNIIIQLVIASIIIIALGVSSTLQGIVNTRKGNEQEVHSKKKLLLNIIYSVILSILLNIMIYLSIS